MSKPFAFVDKNGVINIDVTDRTIDTTDQPAIERKDLKYNGKDAAEFVRGFNAAQKENKNIGDHAVEAGVTTFTPNAPYAKGVSEGLKR